MMRTAWCFVLLLPLVTMISPASPTVAQAQEGPDQATGAQGYSLLSAPSALAPNPVLAEVGSDPVADAGARPSALELALVDLTNADRANSGLPPVQFDPAMLEIARQRALDQTGLPALSHTDANGQIAVGQLAANAGLQYRLIGENLLQVHGSGDEVAVRAETMLMDDPLHRAVVLRPDYDWLAVGSAVDAQGTTIFAEVYRADR